ncbi:TPA: hypothetical protein O2538_002747 [Staphylococcus aureus]|nr:hypothetical protein [Staphylococcus aureus]
MEVNAAGYYVIPRYLGWEEFLIHTRDVLACGNRMYIQFSMKEGPVLVADFRKENGLGLDNSWLFTVSGVGHTHTLIEDITNFKFIQFRPNTEWVAIHMGNTKRIDLEQFEDIWISDTFRKLKPVIVLHQEKFWHVMGLELTGEEDTGWYIYLKRQDSDFMTRIQMPSAQKFIFNPLSNSWSMDAPTAEITDLEKIKKELKSEDVSEVIVSGVPMRLIRVHEISKGVLFFVFIDTAEKRRYYYARRTTKLRIVTNPDTLRKEYLLDHVKAMHID